MKYFRVHFGYDKSIPITEAELRKVLAAHITGGVAVLNNASINGKYISLIEPDYHRAMGFNEGYKLQPEDWQYIRRDCADYEGYLAEVKEKVAVLISQGKGQALLNSETLRLSQR